MERLKQDIQARLMVAAHNRPDKFISQQDTDIPLNKLTFVYKDADGTILKSGMVPKGTSIKGRLPKWGKGEYLLVLKCKKGYSTGCSATGMVAIAMK
ncbi:hypothetical protein ACQKIW_30155 [Bacillus thuringiensis]|uniref:hypothetical protein n=1 Tax=Bacillus thuringiensis TaxID=1428 RepID=UPI003D046423